MDRWFDWLLSMGCFVEGNDDDIIEVEVFLDCLDLFSYELLARAVRSFSESVLESFSIEVGDSVTEMVVDLFLE